MVKRALIILALAGGVTWWYQQAQAPSVVSAASSGSAASSVADDSALAVKAAAVRPPGGLAPRAWSVLGGKLVPGRALRERFDSYLPLGRGVTMVEVRAALERDAEADLGRANSAQVLAIWDRYARLQNYDWQQPLNNADSKGWQATLTEQHQVRRQLLGVDWAEAFFSEDEAAFQRRLAGQVAVRRPVKPSLDEVLSRVPSMGSAALAASSAASGDWRARSDKARLEWGHLTQDASLDEGQRLMRMRLYLQQNFTAQDAAKVARELQLP